MISWNRSSKNREYSLDIAEGLAREVVPEQDPEVAAWDLLVVLDDTIHAVGVRQHELDWDGYTIARRHVRPVLAEAARRVRSARGE